MSHIVAIVLAACGVAFGLTAFTTVSVRSEKHKGLIASSFAVCFIVLTALFVWTDLPAAMMARIAGTGLMIGVLCMILLKAGLHVERKSGLR